MDLKRKKIYIAVVVFLAALFFIINAGPTLAAECKSRTPKEEILSRVRPFISFAEKTAKDFGYQIALAAAPDPDDAFCNASDTVFCTGNRSDATMSWTSAPPVKAGWGDFVYYCITTDLDAGDADFYLNKSCGADKMILARDPANNNSVGLLEGKLYPWNMSAYYYWDDAAQGNLGFPTGYYRLYKKTYYGGFFFAANCTTYNLSVINSGAGSGTVNFNPPDSNFALIASGSHSEPYNGPRIIRDDPVAGMLNHFGFWGFNAPAAVDNNVNSQAWSTDLAGPGSRLMIDLGAGNEKYYRIVRLYVSKPEAAYNGKYNIQYSDDNLNWSNAVTGFAPAPIGWNEKTWANVGAHRYWRLYLTNTPGPGSWINEIEFDNFAPTIVTLTASADAGSTFAGWSGEGCSGIGACTVSMTQARNVAATFNLNALPPVYTLTISKAGLGTGTVSAPVGKGDGISCGANCTEDYNSGTVVNLSEIADPGSIFGGWTGDADCADGSVAMDANKTCTAIFNNLSADLTANKTSGDAPLSGVVFTADALGSAVGTVNYTFYCNRADNGVNITAGWAHKLDGTNLDPYIAPAGICDAVYSSIGVYTAKVIIERQGLAAEKRIIITVSVPSVPAAPSNLQAAAVSCSQINLTWQDNSNNETRFELQQSKNSGFPSPPPPGSTITFIKGADVNSHFDTGLAENTKYYYRVRACNAINCSAYSPTVSQTTSACPQPPEAAIYANGSSTVFIDWGKSANITWCDKNKADDCKDAKTCEVLKNGAPWQSGISGDLPSGSLTGQTVFKLICYGGAGATQSESTAIVNAVLKPWWKEVIPW